MANMLIGVEFKLKHGAGVTTYRVSGRHRDAGYFECVAVEFAPVPPFKATDFLGQIEIFSRRDIEALVPRFAQKAVA